MKDNISQYFSSRCYPSYIVTLKLIRKNQRNLSQVNIRSFTNTWIILAADFIGD